MKSTKKIFLVLLCVVLTVSASVFGTMAYLTADTGTVTNTFTIGKVDIDLTETGAQNGQKAYVDLVPGGSYDKDPAVTVIADSVDSWVFVKITEGDGTKSVGYEVDTANWKPLAGVANVYYLEYTSAATDTVYGILKDNTVTIPADATETDTIKSLSFYSSAIQKAGFDDAKAAYDKLVAESGAKA